MTGRASSLLAGGRLPKVLASFKFECITTDPASSSKHGGIAQAEQERLPEMSFEHLLVILVRRCY